MDITSLCQSLVIMTTIRRISDLINSLEIILNTYGDAPIFTYNFVGELRKPSIGLADDKCILFGNESAPVLGPSSSSDDITITEDDEDDVVEGEIIPELYDYGSDDDSSEEEFENDENVIAN